MLRRSRIFALARRCHLTEQIGARRRDLFAFDTWAPADENFLWNYKSERQPSAVVTEGQEQDKLEESERPKIRTVSRGAFSNLDTRPSRIQNPEIEIGGRTVELIFAELETVTEANIAAESERTLAKLAGLRTSFKNEATFDEDSFLEEYLVLFRRMGMADAVSTLVLQPVKAVGSARMRVLAFHYETLTCPGLTDLKDLAKTLDSVTHASLTLKQRVALLKLSAFLSHPILQSFLKLAEGGTQAIKKPSRAQVKAINLPETSLLSRTLMQELRDPTTMAGYRLRIGEAYFPHRFGNWINSGAPQTASNLPVEERVNAGFRLKFS